MTKLEIITGDQRITDLQNAVSDAMHDAMVAGLELDYIASTLAGVAADYIRLEYGDEALKSLAAVVIARTGEPLPNIE